MITLVNDHHHTGAAEKCFFQCHEKKVSVYWNPPLRLEPGTSWTRVLDTPNMFIYVDGIASLTFH